MAANSDKARRERVTRLTSLALFRKSGDAGATTDPNPTLFCINITREQLAAADLGFKATALPIGPPIFHGCHGELGAIAEHLCGQIRNAQPRGPYFLAGYCLGGWVAFEVARLLEQTAEKVALVCLIEAPHLNQILRLRSLRRLLLAVTRPALLLRRLRARTQTIARTPPASVASQVERDYLDAMGDACVKFSLRPYQGDVILLFGADSACRVFPRYGWRSTALGGVDVHIVPGTHDLDSLLSSRAIPTIIGGLIRARSESAPTAGASTGAAHASADIVEHPARAEG